MGFPGLRSALATRTAEQGQKFLPGRLTHQAVLDGQPEGHQITREAQGENLQARCNRNPSLLAPKLVLVYDICALDLKGDPRDVCEKRDSRRRSTRLQALLSG